MMKIATATERHDLHRWAYAAIRAGNSQNVSDVERCCDILRYLMRLNLSDKDIANSKAIPPLANLREHENPKIRTEADDLFNSWMRTLYSGGRNSSTCNKALPLDLKKPNVLKVRSELKKNEHQRSSHAIATESTKKMDFWGLKKNEDEGSQAHETGESKQIDDCKSFAARSLQTQKQTPVPDNVSENPKRCPILKSVRDTTYKKTIPTKVHLTQKKPDAVQVFSKLNKTEDQRSRAHETGETRQNLKTPNDCKSFAAKSIQAKKQSAIPMTLSKNPRSFGAHELGRIKLNLKKPDVCKSVPATSRPIQMKKTQPPLKVSENPKYCPALKKNLTEMLELFEVAKKSADVANAKGLLAAKTETSICVDTLSLLMDYPISSTATETRRIMMRLEHLTKHKDRRICNSASALLHHWRQSIRDQEQKESRKTQG